MAQKAEAEEAAVQGEELNGHLFNVNSHVTSKSRALKMSARKCPQLADQNRDKMVGEEGFEPPTSCSQIAIFVLIVKELQGLTSY